MAEPEQGRGWRLVLAQVSFTRAYRAGGPCRTVGMHPSGQVQHFHHKTNEPHCLGFLLFLTADRPARRGRLDTGNKMIRSWARRSLGSGQATLDPTVLGNLPPTLPHTAVHPRRVPHISPVEFNRSARPLFWSQGPLRG